MYVYAIGNIVAMDVERTGPSLHQAGHNVGCERIQIDEGSLCEPVELQPFVHQVGGHTSMFRFNESTVCKPLCSREYHFYSTLPPELHPFTAECRGVVQVEIENMDTNEARVWARRVIPDRERSINTTSPSEQSPSQNQNETSQEVVSNKAISQASSNQNPWVKNIFHRQLRKFHSNSANKFLLLENMVAEYRKPCVLDLKMGKRQHGDDASLEKIQLFKERCRASTSSELGVRASGMQIYQVDSGEYIFYSKYDGRALTVEGFKDNLVKFLHNGQRVRMELIKVILTQLRHLKSVVQTLDTYRFYSSSLLIMYDGHLNDHINTMDSPDSVLCDQEGCHSNSSRDLDENTCVQIKMVDFAHSTFQSFEPNDQQHNGPDLGYLCGLATLIKMFQDLQQQHSSNR